MSAGISCGRPWLCWSLMTSDVRLFKFLHKLNAWSEFFWYHTQKNQFCQTYGTKPKSLLVPKLTYILISKKYWHKVRLISKKYWCKVRLMVKLQEVSSVALTVNISIWCVQVCIRDILWLNTYKKWGGKAVCLHLHISTIHGYNMRLPTHKTSR